MLAAERDERRKTVVFVVDEAHLLTIEQLGQLRLLTNADMDARSPLALILLGQPTCAANSSSATSPRSTSALPCATTSTGCPSTRTAAYLKHHLAIAGRSDTLFSDDAVTLIHQTSRGIPRAINNLAVQALIAAYAHGKGIVDHSSAKAAVTEVTADGWTTFGPAPARRRLHRRRPAPSPDHPGLERGLDRRHALVSRTRGGRRDLLR